MENNIIELKPLIRMGAEKLREEILELVKNADAKLLKMFAALSEVYGEEESDWWDELSEEDKADIDLGLKQADEGRFIPHAEVMAEVRAKYKKQ